MENCDEYKGEGWGLGEFMERNWNKLNIPEIILYEGDLVLKKFKTDNRQIMLK